MNAFSTTARDMAAALLGKRRVPQEVRIVTKTYGGAMGPRYVVLCAGEYYTCGQRALELLQNGTLTPEELELEIAEEV
jgi:hypothetical protein